MLKKLLVTIMLALQAAIATSTALGHGTSALLPQRNPPSSLSRYFDPKVGMSADEAVAYALTHNGELAAVRNEIEAARGPVKQASRRKNPQLDIEQKEQVKRLRQRHDNWFDRERPTQTSLQKILCKLTLLRANSLTNNANVSVPMLSLI